MDELLDWTRPLRPLLWFPAGFLLGWLVERIVLGRLRAWAARTTWEGDDVVLDAVRHLPRLWGLLVGIHLGVSGLELPRATDELLHKGLLVALVLSATLVVERVARGFVRLYTRSVEGIVPATSIFHSLTRVGVWAIGVLIALQSVGISIAPVLTALGVGGLATALALQPTLSNLFSGVQILASRSINAGDYIRVDGAEEGFVHDINWRVTTLRTFQNNLVLIPNAKLVSAVVTNHHFPDSELTFTVPFGVAYGSDLAKVEATVLEVAHAVQALDGAVPEHEPVLRLTALGECSVDMLVVLRARAMPDVGPLRDQFLRKILPAFDREGVEIPFPHRVVVRREA